MSKFKENDKVKVVSCLQPTYWYANKIGQEFTLNEYNASFGWSIKEDYRAHLKECDIVHVQEKEEMQFDGKTFNLKTQPWFIRVNNEEEFEAVNKWVKENAEYELFTPYFDGMVAISNTDDEGDVWVRLMYVKDGSRIVRSNITCHEIKVNFKTVIDSVEFPIVESEQQKKIRELQETIETAKRQIEELKELK